MSDIYLLLCMMFMHIVDDYYLQGWLASAKQKEYWNKNAPQDLYKYDYIWALIMHSFSWAFMIMSPIAFASHFSINFIFIMVFLINVAVHAIIDDLKANKKKINLWVDQIIHIIQIIITYLIFIH